jgi:hypothetical protein
MELHQVRYFLAVCKEKSFTRAAKHCGVSQPSLSDAIKRLEQELGGQLFHRSRVNCLLSELGQEVWPHLCKARPMCPRRSQASGTFFNCATGLSCGFGTDAIEQQATHPRQFGIHLGNPEQQEKGTQNAKADLLYRSVCTRRRRDFCLVTKRARLLGRQQCIGHIPSASVALGGGSGDDTGDVAD